jgi:signal transduction histidine kinase
MVNEALVTRLTEHKLLGSAPRAELEWLVAHGDRHVFPIGALVTAKGEPAVGLYVIFAGHIAIHLDRGAGSRKIIEWRTGDVTGILPYSRGARPPGASIAEEPTETLLVLAEHFPEMIRECPVVTARLVHNMLDRARHFTSSIHQDEKLISLGKLAAGLAHELNNPASAATRSAQLLASALSDAERAGRALAAARLTDAQLAVIDDVRWLCASSTAPLRRTAMQRADREDEIGEWLAARDIDDVIAAPLSESGVTMEALDLLSGTLAGPALDAALRSIAAGCFVRTLTADVQTASARIYDLVAAVKGFTYMDQAPTSEAVDLRRGLLDTLAVLGAKVRGKSLDVTTDLSEDLPRVAGFGGELNQVWMNLIDNALDAAPDGGHVEVTARREQDRVAVRIVDNGAGIPQDIQGRIFDPFFTTKGVGKGTGLGLDIVRRLLQRCDGEIDVESQPGRTTFRVSLPLAAGMDAMPGTGYPGRQRTARRASGAATR